MIEELRVFRSNIEVEFEWDEAKADSNWLSQGVSFDLAKAVFHDPFAIERLDDREDYGEERFVLSGMAEGQHLLYVAFTERGERIRLISADRVTKNEEADYFHQNA